MPRKYTKKRRTIRRRPRRKTRMYRNIGTISGLPRQRTVTMKYVQNITLVSATGLLGSLRFRANGIFDPYYETGGHQPFGYDTWATMYDHYVVNGSKITVQVVDDTGTHQPTVIGIALADDVALPYASWTTYIEANKGSNRIMAGILSGPQTIKSYYSAKKFFNLKDVKDNVARIGSGIASDPSENAIYHVWVQAVDLAATTPSYQGKVTIEYNVTFSEPKDLAAS